jgi:hypothetical protein
LFVWRLQEENEEEKQKQKPLVVALLQVAKRMQAVFVYVGVWVVVLW